MTTAQRTDANQPGGSIMSTKVTCVQDHQDLHVASVYKTLLPEPP